MPQGNSTSLRDGKQDQVAATLTLLHLVEAGRLDGLPCPQCKEAAVSVWIARPSPVEYRTWLICQKCGFRTRAHDTGRPSYYTPERDLSRKEAVTT